MKIQCMIHNNEYTSNTKNEQDDANMSDLVHIQCLFDNATKSDVNEVKIYNTRVRESGEIQYNINNIIASAE